MVLDISTSLSLARFFPFFAPFFLLICSIALSASTTSASGLSGTAGDHNNQIQVQNEDHQETILFGSCNRQVSLILSPSLDSFSRICLKTIGTALRCLRRKISSGLVMLSTQKTLKLMVYNLLWNHFHPMNITFDFGTVRGSMVPGMIMVSSH
jgi:hypothetical protein